MEDHQDIVNNKSAGSTQLSSDESTTPAVKDQGVGSSIARPEVLPGSPRARSKDDKSKPAGAIADTPGPVSESEARATPDNQPASTTDDADAEGGPFDFGGLPNRNLKKNLGCG